MSNQKLFRQLENDGFKIGSTMLLIDGQHVRQRTRWNSGNSGKMFTTTWELKFKRISKANLEKQFSVNLI